MHLLPRPGVKLKGRSLVTDIKHVHNARIYQVESVELRAAFIVRVQIQTANTIGFHIKSNTAIFHYILRPVYTCNFCCDFK